MDNKTRRDSEMAYIADEAVLAEMKETRKLVQKFNQADATDENRLQMLLRELIGDM